MTWKQWQRANLPARFHKHRRTPGLWVQHSTETAHSISKSCLGGIVVVGGAGRLKNNMQGNIVSQWKGHCQCQHQVTGAVSTTSGVAGVSVSLGGGVRMGTSSPADGRTAGSAGLASTVFTGSAGVAASAGFLSAAFFPETLPTAFFAAPAAKGSNYIFTVSVHNCKAYLAEMQGSPMYRKVD